jgi:SUMO ligase MMS21 Smc5/6 complex component
MYIRESEEIIQAKVKNNIISLSQGEELVDTLLGAGKKNADDEDIEIIQESIRLSLRCPISLLRIVTPVKGITCKHPNVSQIWL